MSPRPSRTPRPAWSYLGGLTPVLLVWLVLVVWLARVLYDQADWSDRADEATVREWLDEARNFRKTLPELVREYARLRADDGPDAPRVHEKRDEIAEHIRGLAEPGRIYLNQLPSFPIIYRLEATAAGDPPVTWVNPLPRPRQERQANVRVLAYNPVGPADPLAIVRCEYQLHVYDQLRGREAQKQRVSLVAGAVLAAATLLAGLFVTVFLRRERRRELARLTREADAEHVERELLEARIRQQDADRQREDLDRRLLEQKLDAAQLQKRADEAEKSTLEMRSQLYAGIGIMAGSYAHNIKNLLVRPNDLLARCMEAADLPRDQAGMLAEVRGTLGTVTERLQEILRTVRRDPHKSELTTVDLAALVRETAATWGEMAREKWKLTVSAAAPAGPLWVRGDLSHLQQAVENLLFNARDATFEMRNHLRETARASPAERKQRLIDAAGWRGEVRLTARRDGDTVVLEVRDNGIGMTAAVRDQCLTTHFTTKRDNALYEGYNAGMGLGLSFVAVVLEHHRATLTIESEQLRGATFRATFPSADTTQPAVT